MDGYSLLAAEQIGQGWFILSGDSNIFTDQLRLELGVDIYALYDNDTLAYNICNWERNGEPNPAERAAELLNDFDAWVADGDLVGEGKTAGAGAGKLGALRNMLLEAKTYLEAGQHELACDLLRSALGKTDGDPNPPDFVSGAAAASLAAAIQSLIVEMGCSS